MKRRRNWEPERLEESWLVLAIGCFLFFSITKSLRNCKPIDLKMYLSNMIKMKNQPTVEFHSLKANASHFG